MDPEQPQLLTSKDTRFYNLEVLTEKEQTTTLQKQIEEHEQRSRVDMLSRYNIGLCDAISEVAREKYIEEKRRQQIRQNHDQLKLLEENLRAAYARKAISAQIFERKALDDKAKYLERYKNEEMEEDRLKYHEFLKKQDEEKKAKASAYKAALEEQMRETKEKRLEQYMENMEEKRVNDALLQKCKEDLKKTQRDAAAFKAREKEEMEESLRAKQKALKKLEVIKQADAERIKKNTVMLELRRQKEAEEKRKHMEQQLELSQEIGRQIYEKDQSVIKRREKLIELLFHEKQEKDLMRYRSDLEQSHRASIAMRIQMEEDLFNKEEDMLRHKTLRMKEHAEAMRVLAERDKLEQLSDENRRRKQMEHRRELQNAFDKKKEVKVEEMKNEILSSMAQLRKEQQKEETLKSERIRLIVEHGPGLLDHLPLGLLDETEMEMVRNLANR